MRSQTSRGVPEWSGGKDLYMGSLILVAGKVSRIIGIVPGVPKGVRGSTKEVHLPQGATWAVGVCALAYMGQGHQPQEAHAPRDKKKRESPKGGRHLRGTLGRKDSSLAAPFLGGRAKAAPPSPLALYIVGEGRAAAPKPWRLPLPPVTHLPPPRLRLAKPCRDPATSTTTPSCCWISINLSSPLAGSRRRRHRCSVRVLNAVVPSVRR